MSGQIIGGSVAQEKGANFGILTPNNIADLVREDKYSQKDGYVYLGSYDYTSSTFSTVIQFLTVDNGGYVDPTNYRTHMVLCSQIRNSGPYSMNIVLTTRNAGNTGNSTGNYYGWGYETLQDSSDNNTKRNQDSSSYWGMSNTGLDGDDDSQATQVIYFFDIGDNTKYLTMYSRIALRRNSYTGRHNSYDYGGTQGNRNDMGGFNWGGYTSSTWNAKFDIYGIMEK